MMFDADAAYCEIYQVLDELRVAHYVSVGAFGRVFMAVDALKAARAPAKDIATAERISVAMIRWQRSRYFSRQAGEAYFRGQLKELTADWLEVRLPRSATPVRRKTSTTPLPCTNRMPA